MKKLEIHQDWLSELLPEGLPYPSSTLISGPGGSGKPLVALGLVYDWLHAGGNVIFIPLQYPEMKFVKTSFNQLYDLNLEEYQKKVSYIRFDLDVDTWEEDGKNTLKANLLKPNVWNEAIQKLERAFDEEDPGTLVFASALNLLLFSPTYRKPILESIKELIIGEKSRTYLFAVSTTAYREDVRIWEQAADNLLFTRMEEGMKIYLRVEKVENREVSPKETRVPIQRAMLEDIKQVADEVKRRKIPKLKQI